ncbi:hypothetical protein LVT17_25970, partial [Klebsiella pneumoniae]|nr:hypothetical protein [Klebsiella pneumoniae]
MAQVPLPTPTDNDVPSTDIRDHLFAGAKLDEAMTSSQLTYIDRLGVEHITFAGFESKANDTIIAVGHSAAVSQSIVSASAQAAIQDINSTVTQTANDAAVVLSWLGYLPPAPFSSGLSVSSTRFTVTYNGNTYAAIADKVPFTTTSTFDGSQWRLLAGVMS